MFENFGTAEIEGIVLALLVLARIFVYLTPTKEDDAWMSKNTSKWLKILAIVTGLDLRQGRKKYIDK